MSIVKGCHAWTNIARRLCILSPRSQSCRNRMICPPILDMISQSPMVVVGNCQHAGRPRTVRRWIRHSSAFLVHYSYAGLFPPSVHRKIIRSVIVRLVRSLKEMVPPKSFPSKNLARFAGSSILLFVFCLFKFGFGDLQEFRANLVGRSGRVHGVGSSLRVSFPEGKPVVSLLS